MLDKLSKEERTVLFFWIVLGAILMLLALFIGGRKINEKKYEQTKENNYHILTDYSRYYTIINIMEKYYSTINSKNYDDTLKLLSNDYKSSNNINKNNINEKIKYYDKSVTFKGKLMCSKKLGKGYTSYYISGDVIGMNNNNVYESTFYNVTLNENDFTFNISLIEESEFGGKCHA